MQERGKVFVLTVFIWKFDPKNDRAKCDIILVSFLFIFFLFFTVSVVNDSDRGSAAKSNQAIMTCINIAACVAKFPHLHLVLSTLHQNLLSE